MKKKGQRARQKKVTILLPEELLSQALDSTGEGISETIKMGLRLIAAGHAYDRLRKLRGAVKVSIDVSTLRNE
jgi:hypothetical protein